MKGKYDLLLSNNHTKIKMAVTETVFLNLVSSFVFEIGKTFLERGFWEKKKKEIDTQVKKKFANKYERLYSSGVIIDYLKSPLVVDTVQNYVLYVITEKYEKTISEEGLVKRKKYETFDDEDLCVFLIEKLKEKIKEEKTIGNEILYSSGQLTDAEKFVRELVVFTNKYYCNLLDKDKQLIVFLINKRIDRWGNEISKRISNVLEILNTSIDFAYIEEIPKLVDQKKEYAKVLKENFKMAHIYLLDKFEINEFYVPPYLSSGASEGGFASYNTELNRILGKGIYSEERDNDWKHIFDNNNIVYITGGAGYGKSLLLKKIVEGYEELNIRNASDYLVIYGDLKNFYNNSTSEIMPIVDYLQDSMIRGTLLDKRVISKELVNHYLRMGRCIVLLDALDEVDKTLRQELHERIINFFKTQNPNNKICITSRARGFLPEKDIEVLSIMPLENKQIRKYVDNIINLGKFDRKDKFVFLEQSQELVDKGFLNSFLVLSLLINIFKGETELPENKLELYQKCFEYISHKREKEKSKARYDWGLISTIIKDNTFMELAHMCFPNNSEISKVEVKTYLTKMYKTKYTSENTTENAIDQFLSFCADRTELFVPSSGEDCFKFFHRSFYEYFYSLYLSMRISTAEGVYKLWSKFDVDSEVFELTLAMYKQKDERKYIDMLEYMMKILSSSKIGGKKKDILTAINIFILCLQVIDDEYYLNAFMKYLISNKNMIVSNIRAIHNQDILQKYIVQNDSFVKQIADNYREYAIWNIIRSFTDMYKRMERLTSNGHARENMKILLKHFYSYDFYTNLFFNNCSNEDIFIFFSEEKVRGLGEQIHMPSKEINMIAGKMKKFLELSPETQEAIKSMLF